MSDAIIVALITGACAVLSQVFISRASTKDLLSKIERQSEITDIQLDAKLEKHMAIINTEVAELTREVREHNNFAKRMPVLEEKVAQLEKKGA